MEGTGRLAPLLFSAGLPLLGAHSSIPAGGHAGASRGNGGVARLPRFDMYIYKVIQCC